jgi:phosphotriesterase-related protein
MGVPVPTARGDEVDSEALGFTLMTEHIFLVDAEVAINWPEVFGDPERRVEDAVRKLAVAHERGLRTLVDRTAVGIGRNVPLVKRVAERTPVNIVVSTGFYTQNDLPLFFAFRESEPQFEGRTGEKLEDFLVRDVEDGIGDTGVRAAIIKCATDAQGVTEGVDYALRATARAHRRTGAPIFTHTNGAEAGLEQQRVFEEEGVDLSRVMIGHIDRTPADEQEKIERIIERGSVVGFDSFGFKDGVGPPMEPEADRLRWIAELCATGHAGRIVLAHDQPSFTDLIPDDLEDALQAERGTWTWLLDVGLDRLRELGVTDEQLELMTVGNPRDIFESRALGPY